MKKNKKNTVVEHKVLQFLFWLKEDSYGQRNTHWIIMDCPEGVTDADDADAYLEKNMRRLMDENDWSVVFDYKVREVGYNLKTPAQKKEIATTNAIKRVVEDGLTDKEVVFEAGTAILRFEPKGLPKQEFKVFDLAKSIIGDRITNRDPFGGDPETIFSIVDENGNNVMQVLDVEVYRRHAAQVVLYEGNAEMMEQIHAGKIRFKQEFMCLPEFDTLSNEQKDTFMKELDEMIDNSQMSKGHVVFNGAESAAIVYNGYTIMFNPSALYAQFLKNRAALDPKITDVIKEVKALPSNKEETE